MLAMKKITILFLTLALVPLFTFAQATYTPSADNLAARKEFEEERFGIFIHWGIYSLFAQGEWYLNAGINEEEYAKSAEAFYPHRFNADEWAKAIKASGARYITFTSRHHDGFSMFHTGESAYNIVDGTPFGRDIAEELSKACERQGLNLHFYYSILDWRRNDYPVGRTGLRTGRQLKPDYNSYFNFMKRQIGELLSGRYGDVKALWFDGYWDHEADSVPFDWRMEELYDYIHTLRPACLIGNNHHITPLKGEDFQMFERDLPGENTAGLSGQEVSALPLEMCQTMNGMWGYKVSDQNYKSGAELIRLLIRAAGKGSNLLLNIGPQPDGSLPETALERLKEIGAWMNVYGETIYGTQRGIIAETQHYTSTQNGKRLFLHVLDASSQTLSFALPSGYKQARLFPQGTPAHVQFDKRNNQVTLTLPNTTNSPDQVIEFILP